MVEFALVAPLMLLLVFGIVEFSLAMFAQQVLEGATLGAARSGKTGYITAGKTQTQTIADAVKERAGMLLDMDKVTITPIAYSQFDQIGQPEPFVDTNYNGVRDPGENYTDSNHNGQYDTDMGTSGPGDSDEVVVYTITYPWKVITPLVGQFLGSGGTLTLTSRTVVKNEPY